MRRVVHHFEKNNENLTKERDVLKRDLQSEHQTAEQSSALYQESQHEVRAFKDIISGMDLKVKKQLEDIKKLKKEKSKKLDEIQHWIDKVDLLQSKSYFFLLFALSISLILPTNRRNSPQGELRD